VLNLINTFFISHTTTKQQKWSNESKNPNLASSPAGEQIGTDFQYEVK
jgi:hypothetical protein